MRMACKSSHVRVGIDPNPPITPPDDVDPDSTMSTFVPIPLKTAATRALAPSPTATIEMTDATPMMTPSAVRKLRVLFRISAPSAMGSNVREVHAACSAVLGCCSTSETIFPSRTTSTREA